MRGCKLSGANWSEDEMAEKLKRIMDIIKKRRAWIGVAMLLVAGGVAAAFFLSNKTSASDYITGKVERGNVEVNVSATGTVQAVTTVQVGSQVSGTLLWLGADFNTQVKRGQVIAKLDPSIFQAQVDNARASVANQEAAIQAAQTEILNQKANILSVKANQEVARVQRDDAIALVQRYQEIKSVIPGRDIELAQANANVAKARYEQATAQVSQAQAASSSAVARLAQANASLAQSKAQLQQSQANLDHSIITSPIDGVVVSRNVDVGQTVAASLSAPTLFTIANDLTKMQVLASIDEADVGQIKQGIKASFTVDAFPGETFTGEISQLRLNSQNLQNVVTYSAVIDVANPELKLRPGMTTNITISVARRDNVLTIPNSALRFKPTLSEKEQQEMTAKMEERRQQRQAERGQEGQPAEQQNSNAQPQKQEEQGQAPQRGRRSQGQTPQQGAEPQGGQPQAGGQGQPSRGGQRREGQIVYVLVGAKTIEPRFIRTGMTNGRVTEIVGGDLHEGDTIVIGQNDTTGSANRQPTTPFGPQRPGGGGGRGR
jgi:HlyD family secretion protein